MPKQPIDILFRSKILVALIAGVLFLLGVIQVLQGFIETRDYRAHIVEAIKLQTGKEVTIRGTIKVELLPTPTIYIPGIELHGVEEKEPSPALKVEMLWINASPFSLFSDKPKISKIGLIRPTLEIVRTQNNSIRWDWINGDLLKLLTKPAADSSDVAIEISDGKILYRNEHAESEDTLEHVQLSLAGGGHPEMKGSVFYQDHEFRLMVNTRDGEYKRTGDELPLYVKLFSDDKNYVELKGKINLSGAFPKTVGAFSLESDDVMAWLQSKETETKPGLLAQITNESTVKHEQKELLPIKLSGQWSQESWNVALANAQLQGVNSDAKGSIAVSWEKIISLSSELEFTTFNYNAWRALADLFLTKQLRDSGGFYVASEDQEAGPLPKNIDIRLNIKAQKILVDGQDWQDARLSAQLDNGAITVNQFDINMPGESTLTLFGIISQGSNRKLRFDGNMETQGKNLHHTLTIFDPSTSDLPEIGLGKFYARSNIFISSEQVRLSEADVKVNDLRLSGGLVVYYDANPRLEADVKLRDIDFDYFRNTWREKQQSSEEKSDYLTLDKNMKLSWLNKIHTSVDFKISVDDFTFLERKGANASFRLFAKDGQFGIYNIRLYYPDEVMEANFSIDVSSGDQPIYNVLLNANTLDTDYFSVSPKKEASRHAPPIQFVDNGQDGQIQRITIVPQAQDIELPPPPAQGIEDLKPGLPEIKKDKLRDGPLWSEDLIDVRWIENVKGVFDISIGALTHRGAVINNLKFKAKLEDSTMDIQNLSFDYWQGRCEITGSLYGGKVPGISIGATLYNAELHDMLYAFSGRDNITGKINVSGTLITSGVNFLTWVSQAEAKLALSARGVVVQGLNMQGVVDAVMSARTASDVFNSVNQNLTKGATEMSVDGAINIKNGVMRTPGITLKTDTITGNFVGEVKLLPWTMDMTTFFQFPAIPSDTIPTMTVQLAGPIATPVLQMDTSSLEAYVAKRIVGR